MTTINLFESAAALTDIDDACRMLQDHFNIATGDGAGLFFGNTGRGTWADMQADERFLCLREWIQTECGVPLICAGDIIKFKPEWQDGGDDDITFIAMDDEEKGRIVVEGQVDLPIKPQQTVSVTWIASHQHSDESYLRAFGTLGFELWQTGGGCTAFGYRINRFEGRTVEAPYMMVTDSEGCEAPDGTSAAVILGYYDRSGDYIIQYVCDMNQAIACARFIDNLDAQVSVPKGYEIRHRSQMLDGDGNVEDFAKGKHWWLLDSRTDPIKGFDCLSEMAAKPMTRGAWVDSFRVVRPVDKGFDEICHDHDIDTGGHFEFVAVWMSACGHFVELDDEGTSKFHIVIERSEWMVPTADDAMTILWDKWSKHELAARV